MSIYMWKEPIIVSDMKWPCDNGFHIPTDTEWTNLINAWVSLWAWTNTWILNFTSMLKLPQMWAISWSSWTSKYDFWTYAYYWCGTCNDSNANCLNASSSNIRKRTSYTANAMPIRAFKDTSITPDISWTTIYQWTWDAWIYHNSTLWLISISSDGTTRYTIQDKNLGATAIWNSGDTMSQDNCGNYYQRWNCYWFPFTWATSTSSNRPLVWDYWPTNYYTDSTFITVSSSPYNWMYSTNKDLWGWVSQWTHSEWWWDMEPKKIYIRVEAQPITTAWIYHNSDLWLISLSSDGTTWLTIADKNLWATNVWDYWNLYQWGNNYWFPNGWSVTTSSTLVDASTYWPGNYYSGSTYITTARNVWWDSSHNANLWGATTWTLEAMQWPCDAWYHIPTNTELQSLINLWVNIWAWTLSGWNPLTTLLLMTKAWLRQNDWSRLNQWSWWYYRSSNLYSQDNPYVLRFDASIIIPDDYYIQSFWMSLRPFKNEPRPPYEWEEWWTKLY